MVTYKKGNLDGRKKFKTWQRNPREIIGPVRARSDPDRKKHQPTVAYRDHIKSLANRIPLPPEVMPPEKLWQSVKRQGMDFPICCVLSETKYETVICFISGQTAYFVWANEMEHWVKKSIMYSTNRARVMFSDGTGTPRINEIIWVERIDTVSP